MKNSASVARVETAALQAGIEIDIIWFEETAKTAMRAAELIGCEVGQIANSLIFQGVDSGTLHLLLTSGANRVDLDFAKPQIGEALARADAKSIRSETGFAIGGVAPIGHLTQPNVWMDSALLAYDTVWAAAGRSETVFAIDPESLQNITQATLFDAAAPLG